MIGDDILYQAKEFTGLSAGKYICSKDILPCMCVHVCVHVYVCV